MPSPDAIYAGDAIYERETRLAPPLPCVRARTDVDSVTPCGETPLWTAPSPSLLEPKIPEFTPGETLCPVPNRSDTVPPPCSEIPEFTTGEISWTTPVPNCSDTVPPLFCEIPEYTTAAPGETLRPVPNRSDTVPPPCKDPPE